LYSIVQYFESIVLKRKGTTTIFKTDNVAELVSNWFNYRHHWRTESRANKYSCKYAYKALPKFQLHSWAHFYPNRKIIDLIECVVVNPCETSMLGKTNWIVHCSM